VSCRGLGLHGGPAGMTAYAARVCGASWRDPRAGRPAGIWRGGGALRLAAALVLAAAVGCVAATCALADGDPASDYLLAQSTFLSPYDGHVSAPVQNELIQVLASAQSAGLSLKVAVIATAADLGADPQFFRLAQPYAEFLSTEDYYFWKTELLVVMPNGYGVAQEGKTVPRDAAVLAGLAKVSTTSGTLMVRAAIRGVVAMAKARGITLTPGHASAGGSSTLDERLEIGAVGGVLLVALGYVTLIRRRR
jgi:hypothetical protein